MGGLVGLGRFELPTSPLSGVRSNQLSYRPENVHSFHPLKHHWNVCEQIFSADKTAARVISLDKADGIYQKSL